MFFAAKDAVAQETQRRALLIGGTEYEKAGFTDLAYPEADTKALNAVLEEAGFEVTLMLGSLAADDPLRATQEKITWQLMTPAAYREANRKTENELQPGFVARLGELDKSDVVLVFLAGHGRQKAKVIGGEVIQEVPYYCPINARSNDEATWISINTLMENISASSGSQNNLLLVDACRDNPSRGRGVDGARATLPGDNLAICFSSSAGTEAYEAESLGHGIFTHFVLEGLKGEAANRRNQVTWDTLVSYVRTAVAEQAPELVQREQFPNAICNVKGVSPILVENTARQPGDGTPLLLHSPFNQNEARAAASSWANHLKLESVFRTEQGHEMVLIPAGEFMMGNEKSEEEIWESFRLENPIWIIGPYDAPQHRVELTEPFFISSTEVTVAQFRAFVETTGYETDAEKDGEGGSGYDSEEKEFSLGSKYTWENVGWTQSDRHPVVNVSWNDAVAYCEWLSKETGRKYQLPTEAQWEFCCRAGEIGWFCFGNDREELARYGNCWDLSAKKYFPPDTHHLQVSDREAFSSPVGRYRSNAFGLKDMHGNASEWCSDWYGGDYYLKSPIRNPVGPASGESRVVRGGAWSLSTIHCRSAERTSREPSDRSGDIGFRVVLVR